jgi:calcineurin-like phosphoesterase family protein
MIYFTSDPHYWHTNIIKMCDRPFASVEEMNEALIANWNAVVGDADTVYVLGDFAFAGTTKIVPILSRLKGRKYLIKGNHDWRYKDDRWIEFGFFAAFPSLTMYNMDVPGGIIKLSHFPYVGGGDHGEYKERYVEHRLHDEGAWLLHGHVHSAWKQNGRMINVGVDQWSMRPVSLSEIEAMINASPITS